MYTIFTVIHVITCVLIVAAVLLQSGRSGGFAGVFGSSGEVIFSTPSGSSFLRKLTTGLAVVFGVTSLTLAVLSKARMYRSVVLEQGAVSQPAPQRQQQAQPAAPAQPQPSTPAPK
ncbi:MAG: preprotein translocase subunit SecG [Elusimicrobia bacterium]|nr:preprotein translocase subunit SecG [Elusimicrobiota bacterium]